MNRDTGFLAKIAIGMVVLLNGVGQLRAAPHYDGSSNQTPNQSPWNWGYDALDKANPLLPPLATFSAAGGATTLDTTPRMADVAGFTTHIANLLSPGLAFTHPDLAPLDRSTGFEIDFTMKLISEQHVSNDRAGFSVVALSSDATPLGIELAFWNNEVWAQNAGFTHGDSSGTFDTTAGLIDYRLAISGTSYTLFANNVQILNGALRDYTAFNNGLPFNSGFPYNQPSFTFFGDDTSSASASVQISKFNVVAVPEPESLILIAQAGATAIFWLRRRMRKRAAAE